MFNVKSLNFFSKDFSSTDNKRLIQLFKDAKKGIFAKDNFFILKKGDTGIIVELKNKKDIRLFEKFRYLMKHIFDDIYNYYIHQKMDHLFLSLTEIKSFEDFHNILVKELCETFEFEKGVFCLYNPDENIIYAVPPGYGVKSVNDILYFRFKLDEKSAASHAISIKDIYWTNDAEKDPYIIKKYVEYFGAYKVVIIPFFYENKLVGLFYGTRGKDGKDFEEEIIPLKMISPSISILLYYLLEVEKRKKREDSIIELHKANLTLSREMDVDKILKLIVENVIKLLNADASSIMMYEKEKEGFYVKSYKGLSDEYALNQFIPYSKVEKVLNQIFEKERKAVITENLQETPFGNPELIKKEGLVSCLSALIFTEHILIGILNVYQKKFRRFTDDDILIIEAFGAQAGVALKNAKLYEKLLQTTESFIITLSEMEALKDFYTLSHSENVATLALKIGMAMGLSQNILDDIYRAGLLHDVGKIIVERELLQKKEKLSDEEMEELKRHVEYSKDIIERIPEFSSITEYIYYHHERYDGKGYPKGLKNDDIPLGARILAVADAIEAMLSERPYRKRMSVEEVKNELIKEKGKQFDPHIVDIALKILNH